MTRFEIHAFHRRFSALGIFGCSVALASLSLSVAHAQANTRPTNDAKQLVQEVIQNELKYNQQDHSHWMYRDNDKTPGKDAVKEVIQTKEASVSRLILLNGNPPTAQARQQDHEKMEQILNDPAARAKQKKNSQHDDAQADSLMKMLPEGFLWTKTGESNGEVTLHFEPNPAFNPPTMASRVFAAMNGTMVVDSKQKRLKILSGKLIRPVEFGWGMLGKLQEGGTFRVVHTEVAPGKWEVTELHVHINGHILFFKSISEQEDDVSSDYKPTPTGMTLQQAAQMLTSGAAAK